MIKYHFSKQINPKIIKKFLLEHSKSSIYYSYEYNKLLSNYLSAQINYIYADEKDEIIALLPFLSKDGPLGTVYNSLAYYGSNGGVIGHKIGSKIIISMIKKFYEIAKLNNVFSATIITNPIFRDYKIYSDLNLHDFKTKRIGQITQLKNKNNILDYFESSGRRNINKALRNKITVNSDNQLKSINFLYSTHKKNMMKIGGIHKSKLFFNKLYKLLNSNNWKIYTAFHNGIPIAALLLLFYNKTVEYFTPVIVSEYRSYQPLSLIIYEAMKDSISNNYQYWNWGGTWINQKNLYNFKKKWAAEDYNYYYYTKLYNREILLKNNDFFLNHYKGFYIIPFDKLK